MCGFAGIVRAEARGVSRDALRRMAASIRHRGPDGFGLFTGPRAGLAHVRLSIVDIEGGAQPLTNEDGQIVVVYNGEIYNYVELRSELRARGHRFRTNSDTEVLVHAYEEWGELMAQRLNGEFAFAIYDRRDHSLLLVRDRFGVRPLYYALRDRDILFGSEIKAILASGEVAAEPDLDGLNEVFTFWAARAPRTPFRGVASLEPSMYAIWRGGKLSLHRYYSPEYHTVRDEPGGALRTLDEIMRSSVDIRLRADVPVGGFLSGGLDSSITCALAAAGSPHDLRTFSITFDDPRLDESEFQQTVARQLGSIHTVEHIGAGDIARIFPAVVWHSETPLVRTAPAPMYLLAKLTRERDIKCVLTGEGSDEVFLGYDIFKEVQVRLFCQRRPESRVRPLLFDRLYPYLRQSGRAGDFWRQFLLDAGPPNDPLVSHMPRFKLAARIKDFYSADTRVALAGADPEAELRQALPSSFPHWSPLHRAAYLELVTLLPSYLLSSQGDRMALAHGVETRFPFLDHRLFELAASLPESSKLCGLREKEILRRWASRILPPSIAQRPKQPYRAPDAAAFFGDGAPEYVSELLDETAIRRTGLFDPRAVAGLVRRGRDGKITSFAENQAAVAVLSTQLWYGQFMQSATESAPESVASPLVPDVELEAAVTA